VATFSWILLVLAVVDIVFTIAQLFMLKGMKLIIHEMHIGLAWLLVVGPPVFVLLLAILALNDKDTGVLWLLMGYGLLAIAGVFQAAATVPILARRREWDAQNKQRDSVRGIN